MADNEILPAQPEVIKEHGMTGLPEGDPQPFSAPQWCYMIVSPNPMHSGGSTYRQPNVHTKVRVIGTSIQDTLISQYCVGTTNVVCQVR